MPLPEHRRAPRRSSRDAAPSTFLWSISPIFTALAMTSSALAWPATTSEKSPFASVVEEYVPGSNPVPGYTNPDSALGPPTQFTGGSFDPMVVSVLNPAWRPDELVSIGAGGHLTLSFDAPVTDDPHNPWGIDLILFGNAFFTADGAVPPGVASPASIFSEGGIISVSADGETWHDISGLVADGLFPTNGYLDVTNAYADEPGEVPADPLRPVNPMLALSAFDGASIEQVQHLYAGSAGGVGVDLATVGLSSIQYVRISNPAGSGVTPEVDGVSDVRPRMPGDVNGDGTVDVNDLLQLLQHWGPAQPTGWDADFNGDAAVDVEDLLVLLGAWG